MRISSLLNFNDFVKGNLYIFIPWFWILGIRNPYNLVSRSPIRKGHKKNGQLSLTVLFNLVLNNLLGFFLLVNLDGQLLSFSGIICNNHIPIG
ncbi:hypothetical protein CLW00_112101 [Mongoliibacter ruber]|uniref:Uncharacterized protein n=1 Tax=Mongoliibacter ruber TaxID=1750599 RepID=A0A2T0WFN2_9BACT|nr:hypothetical protein CLW00_112101 [Mongoliibacter ruber]